MCTLKPENWEGFQTDLLLRDSKKNVGNQLFKEEPMQLVIVGYVTASC